MSAVNCTVDPGGTGDYVSLNAADADLFGATSANLVSNTETVTCTCICTDGNADTTAVTITGFTTNTTYNITIIVSESYRHNGGSYPASGNVYRIEVSASGTPIAIQSSNINLIGLSIKALIAAGSECYGIRVQGSGALTGVNIDSCILIDGTASTTANRRGYYYNTASGIVTNCIAMNWTGSGTYTAGFYTINAGTTLIYNCNAINCSYGFWRYSSNNTTPSNCIAWSCTDSFNGTLTSPLNNAYSEGSDPGSNGVDLSGYAEGDIFVGSGDYHLCSGSPCIGQGTDLSGTFTTDIDGDTRSSWDIGADEYVSAATPITANSTFELPTLSFESTATNYLHIIASAEFALLAFEYSASGTVDTTIDSSAAFELPFIALSATASVDTTIYSSAEVALPMLAFESTATNYLNIIGTAEFALPALSYSATANEIDNIVCSAIFALPVFSHSANTFVLNPIFATASFVLSFLEFDSNGGILTNLQMDTAYRSRRAGTDLLLMAFRGKL